MRVAILSPYPTFPFHERLHCFQHSYENHAIWTMTLADALARLPDTEVHVLTEATNIPSSKTIEANGVCIHYLRAPKYFKTLTLWQMDRWRLHRRLRKLQPDLVHGQGLENQYGYSAAIAPFPRILTIHGISRLSNEVRLVKSHSRERLVEIFTEYCLNRARDIVVINPFIAEVLHLNADGHRLHYIPNAVAPEFFTNEPTTREPDLLVSIGYVDRLKAHDVLARALALLRRRGLLLRMAIIGPVFEDDYTVRLREYIRREGLAIEFLGFQEPERIRSLLRRATMLVHPSRLETFGMTVAEAMATGTPVVASRVGGLPHLVREGETGLLFDPGNAAELADQIHTLLQDQSLRQRLAAAGAAFARETFHPDRIARLTRAAYEEVLGSTGHRQTKPQDYMHVRN